MRKRKRKKGNIMLQQYSSFLKKFAKFSKNVGIFLTI
jgi:hypothetical protein